jgi:hypothetical protein
MCSDFCEDPVRPATRYRDNYDGECAMQIEETGEKGTVCGPIREGKMTGEP